MGRNSIKSGPRMTLAEGPDATSSVVNSTSDFPDSASNVPIYENEIIEEDSPWDLKDLTSKDDRGPSASKRIQKLC